LRLKADEMHKGLSVLKPKWEAGGINPNSEDIEFHIYGIRARSRIIDWISTLTAPEDIFISRIRNRRKCSPRVSP